MALVLCANCGKAVVPQVDPADGSGRVCPRCGAVFPEAGLSLAGWAAIFVVVVIVALIGFTLFRRSHVPVRAPPAVTDAGQRMR
jgi:hypothetical protein